MKKHVIIKMIPLAILVLLIGSYLVLKFSSPQTLLPLNTVEAKNLKQEILEQHADRVMIRYRATNHIQIDCTSKRWDGEDAAEIADIVVDGISKDVFLQSFVERYQKRCGAEDAKPKTLILRLYERGEMLPQFVISSSYPFETWERVS